MNQGINAYTLPHPENDTQVTTSCNLPRPDGGIQVVSSNNLKRPENVNQVIGTDNLNDPGQVTSPSNLSHPDGGLQVVNVYNLKRPDKVVGKDGQGVGIRPPVQETEARTGFEVRSLSAVKALAAKYGMSERNARRYLKSGRTPSPVRRTGMDGKTYSIPCPGLPYSRMVSRLTSARSAVRAVSKLEEMPEWEFQALFSLLQEIGAEATAIINSWSTPPGELSRVDS